MYSDGSERSFRPKWKQLYLWIAYNFDKDVVLCSYCAEAEKMDHAPKKVSQCLSVQSTTCLCFFSYDEAWYSLCEHVMVLVHNAYIGYFIMGIMKTRYSDKF